MLVHLGMRVGFARVQGGALAGVRPDQEHIEGFGGFGPLYFGLHFQRALDGTRNHGAHLSGLVDALCNEIHQLHAADQHGGDKHHDGDRDCRPPVLYAGATDMIVFGAIVRTCFFGAAPIFGDPSGIALDRRRRIGFHLGIFSRYRRRNAGILVGGRIAFGVTGVAPGRIPLFQFVAHRAYRLSRGRRGPNRPLLS